VEDLALPVVGALHFEVLEGVVACTHDLHLEVGKKNGEPEGSF
jgi:hypothetical protein